MAQQRDISTRGQPEDHRPCLFKRWTKEAMEIYRISIPSGRFGQSIHDPDAK